MTGYTVHTGSTKKFASNWDQIFAGKQTKAAAQPPKSVKKTSKKKKNN